MLIIIILYYICCAFLGIKYTCLILATNFIVCVCVGCRSRPTATECLSHKWLQKKKQKKMVRKGSSKKLVKQTENKTKPAAETVSLTSESLSLDTTKDNLKEFCCNKSRSQSPVEIAVVVPSIAQLRIQRDSKMSKTDNRPRATELIVNESIDKTAPNSLIKIDGDENGRLPTISSVVPVTSDPHTTVRELDAQKTGEVLSSAAIDIPLRKVADDGQQTTKWSQMTHLTSNNNYRRSSDVSYLFSNFRTTTTTVSSNFLGSDLQGLSERLQDLQTMFAERDGSIDVGGNLHKLLLNRQQLTAAVADRRPKFRISPMNRDVPVGSPPPASNLMYYMTSSSSCRSAPHSKRASPEHDSSRFSAKEMLLKLFYSDKTAEPKLST